MHRIAGLRIASCRGLCCGPSANVTIQVSSGIREVVLDHTDNRNDSQVSTRRSFWFYAVYIYYIFFQLQAWRSQTAWCGASGLPGHTEKIHRKSTVWISAQMVKTRYQAATTTALCYMTSERESKWPLFTSKPRVTTNSNSLINCVIDVVPLTTHAYEINLTFLYVRHTCALRWSDDWQVTASSPLCQTPTHPVQQEVWSRPHPLHTRRHTDSDLQLEQAGRYVHYFYISCLFVSVFSSASVACVWQCFAVQSQTNKQPTTDCQLLATSSK